MKQIALLVTGIFFFSIAFAQSNKEDIEMVQAIYGKDKKAIVAGFIMPPDDSKKKAFWDLYDKYETERKALGRKRIGLLEKYASNYSSLDNKTIESITNETMALQKSVDGLIITYYNNIKKAVGVKQAAQFYQIESYLLSATRVYIMGNIPFIDELEKLPAPTPAKQ